MKCNSVMLSLFFVSSLIPGLSGYAGNAVSEPKDTPENGIELPLKPDKTLTFSVDEATWMSLDVSPQGDRLVIEVLGDLYLLPVDGGQAIPLSTGMHFDSQPRFSPDGSTIAFISDRGGQEDLWLMAVPGETAADTQDPDKQGLEPRRLTKSDNRTELASPSWSPDGISVVVSKSSWSLRTYELWAYHIAGGNGVQITKAKATDETPSRDRHNALGATFSPDGRYLYYSHKSGGFGYNLRFPLWQIARKDLLTGHEDILTRAQGSAFRPAISPDGNLLVYGTRYEQQTGLRIRHLNSGVDEWLAFPVQKDDQESMFTRDLLPGYAFTPDGKSIVTTRQGKLVRIDLQTKTIADIPFQVAIEKQIASRLYFPYRAEVGPVQARIISNPVLSPNGKKLVFSAFSRIYLYDLENNKAQVISPEGIVAAFPSWSPGGSEVVYVSWQEDGGHIYRQRARKGAKPKQISQHPAFYLYPAWSPDGARIVALRGSGYERQVREGDFGLVVGSDVVWLPVRGGEAQLVIPARGLSRPHFGPESDRVYLQLSAGPFANKGTTLLVSIRYDGTDRREILSSAGPGTFTAEADVPSELLQISPKGSHALIQHANQVYVAALLNPYLQQQKVSIAKSDLPLMKITDVGANFVRWDAKGDNITWSVGNYFYQRPLSSLDFRKNEKTEEEKASSKESEEIESQTLAEAHDAVTVQQIQVYQPRAEVPGSIALVGATAITMGPEGVIEDSVILISDGRIVQVGPKSEIEISQTFELKDVSGKVIVPGYVDTHAHYRTRQGVPSLSNWSFLANLAYGVTTGIDVQPSTIDLISAQDLVDTGQMLGPRVYSTGPGIFSNNEFTSKQHAYGVLKRYRDHYGVRNLKAYISGSRQQRQWLLQAARELELMPTTEGSLDMKLDLTHMIDGFSGNEHNFPLPDLYDDVVQLAAQTRIAYTPTLLVTYGGPWTENRFYANESPHDDPKLRRFTPYYSLAARTLRRGGWFHEKEYATTRIAQQASKIVAAGGQVGIGAHGQLQGLGYHWELWSVASGGSNSQALRSATLMGAEMIGLQQDIGSLEAGKLADLVVLNSNPLDDIRNSADIRFVMKGGALYEGDTLDQVWPISKPLPDQWWWHIDPAETLAR